MLQMRSDSIKQIINSSETWSPWYSLCELQ